jgi:hypothetical protein
MSREINTSIFVKNGPSLAGLGFGGEGFTSFSIASPTGEGLTSARNFARVRRCVLSRRISHRLSPHAGTWPERDGSYRQDLGPFCMIVE